VNTQPVAGWDPGGAGLVSLWAVASVLFGVSFQLITLMADLRAFRSRPFWLLILVKSLAMLFVVMILMVIRGAIAVALGDMTLDEARAEARHLATDREMLVILLYVWLTSVGLGFVRHMSAMVGRRVLVNLLLGKYRRPKTETRIFMFLDLESSTTIAERLGHEKFFELIQECFRDITDSAIRRNVEIYQYVGDEVILTWTPARGLADCNCLRVFFEFKQALEERESFYRARFGVLPRFKAGANMGPVTVAEIGVLKRDIAYLSDVLNTAARLESMCRDYGAQLMITESLKSALPEQNDLVCSRIGQLELRGKNEMVNVYRVDVPS
jgi:adenylate cyclase